MKLNGAGAYQAAVHCATISAAKRIRMWQQQQRRQPSSGRLLLLVGTWIEPVRQVTGNLINEPAECAMDMRRTNLHWYCSAVSREPLSLAKLLPQCS